MKIRYNKKVIRITLAKLVFPSLLLSVLSNTWNFTSIIDISTTDSKLSDPADVRKKLTDMHAFQSDMVAKAADVYVNEVTDTMTYIERDYSQQQELTGTEVHNSQSHDNEEDKKPISIRLPLKNIVLDDVQESPSKKHKKKKSRKKKRSRDNELAEDDVLAAESSASPIPKLIVRKVKKTEGEQEIEKLEVISPVKNREAFMERDVSHTGDQREQFIQNQTKPHVSESDSSQITNSLSNKLYQNEAQISEDVLITPNRKVKEVAVEMRDIHEKTLPPHSESLPIPEDDVVPISKRGRPKRRTIESATEESAVSEGDLTAPEEEVSPTRKRGRPKKTKKPFPANASKSAIMEGEISAQEDGEYEASKRPIISEVETITQEDYVSANRKRGRQRKKVIDEESAVSDGESLSTMSRKRGRRSSATSVTTSLSEGSASDWQEEEGVGERKGKKNIDKQG